MQQAAVGGLVGAVVGVADMRVGDDVGLVVKGAVVGRVVGCAVVGTWVGEVVGVTVGARVRHTLHNDGHSCGPVEHTRDWVSIGNDWHASLSGPSQTGGGEGGEGGRVANPLWRGTGPLESL